MGRLLLILSGILFYLPTESVSQPTPDTSQTDSVRIRDRLERVLDQQISNSETTRRIAEALTRFAENPLNVNQAATEDLSRIPQVSPTVARRIVHYRKTQGALSSLDALSGVEGIDDQRLQSIRPFLTAGPTALKGDDLSFSFPSFEEITTNLDVEILQRATRELNLGQGYKRDSTGQAFEGPPGRLTTRIRVSYDHQFQIAFTLDKDPGEAFRWDPKMRAFGFDHLAGNLAIHDLGPVETLVIGDYAAEFGQGAALWQGLSLGKGQDPVSPLVRDGRGLVPFQSTSENRFFRGIATTLSLPSHFSASTFVSRRHRDATLESSCSKDSSSEKLAAKTLSQGGLHRTENEQQRRDRLRITTVGGAFEYRTTDLLVGTTGYFSRFDRPLRPPDQPYRRFDLSGLRTSMWSLFGSAFFRHYTLFGELARTGTGRYGGLIGASLHHDTGVQALLLARRFPPSFRGLYSSAIGESGGTQNEAGIYSGVRLQVTEKWSVGAYVDQYQFPSSRFSVPRPSSGIDTRLVVKYDPRPWLSTEVQIRAEREGNGTERPGPAGRPLAALQTEARQSAQWHTEYTFSEALTLRTRLQCSRFKRESDPASTGVLIAQGLRLTPFPSLELDARIAFFDTQGYESRLYAYEHDLLYSFSVPVLYGQGQRSYVLAQYSPADNITLEGKYGATWYPHRKTIGSGLNATEGNMERELRIQIRWTL